MCHCGNTRVEWTLNESQHTKLTLEKKILPPLLPWIQTPNLSIMSLVFLPTSYPGHNQECVIDNKLVHLLRLTHDQGGRSTKCVAVQSMRQTIIRTNDHQSWDSQWWNVCPCAHDCLLVYTVQHKTNFWGWGWVAAGSWAEEGRGVSRKSSSDSFLVSEQLWQIVHTDVHFSWFVPPMKFKVKVVESYQKAEESHIQCTQ